MEPQQDDPKDYCSLSRVYVLCMGVCFCFRESNFQRNRGKKARDLDDLISLLVEDSSQTRCKLMAALKELKLNDQNRMSPSQGNLPQAPHAP